MTNRVKDEEFLLNYKKSEPEDRFFIIYNNYVSFPRLLKKIEKKLQFIIKSEKEYLRSHNRGELGVRIQTSNLSNITAELAISNVSLEDSFESGKIDSETLKGVEDAAKYIEYIQILRMMRMDYELLEEIIEDLPYDNTHLIKEYIVEGKNIHDIAKEYDRSYDTIKKRLSNIREDIKEEVVECFSIRFGRAEA